MLITFFFLILKHLSYLKLCNQWLYYISKLFHVFFVFSTRQTHLPGYINQAESLKAKGIKEIACVAVNDPFVMTAWGERYSVGDKVRDANLT